MILDVRKVIIHSYALLVFLFFIPLYSVDTSTSEPEEICMTVFVHGIIDIKPHLSLLNLIRFMRDQITDSIYARAVEIMRKDPFFYQYSAMQELGLHKIDFSRTNEGYVAGAFALAYEQFYLFNNHNPNVKNIYYTFGWSGLLSTQVRYQEAAFFYEQLENEINEYKKKGIIPKIRVMGYSHGGYIALNLGAVFNNLNPANPTWFVDELILLGVPVISDTDFLVNSNLFKKIYHFYSPGDRVQVVDCLATNRFFSHRIFSSRYGFFLPKKLTQIQFRCKRIARTTFAKNGCKHHTKHYPPKMLRNADPGHTELWSFGWSSGYRSYLPLYPFPAGVYLSYIINALQQQGPFENHIIIDIHPFQNCMKISNVDLTKKVTVDFPSAEEQNHITALIKPFGPNDCSKQLYLKKAQHALTIAQIPEKILSLRAQQMNMQDFLELWTLLNKK